MKKANNCGTKEDKNGLGTPLRRLYDFDRSRGLWRLTAPLPLIFLSSALLAQQQTFHNAGTCITTNGQGFAPYLGPLAILLSATITWILAHKTISANREIARNRATFDYLSRLSWDADFLEQRRLFLEIRASDKKMASIASTYERLKNDDHPDAEEFEEALKKHTAVRTILNEYEAMAVGIFTGTLSEEIVKRNYRQQIVDAVVACDEFISITKNHATVKEPEKLYCECQNLVKKWRNGA